ncbi:hypothetical protein Tco_0162324 [Tanacetum coccineum]
MGRDFLRDIFVLVVEVAFGTIGVVICVLFVHEKMERGLDSDESMRMEQYLTHTDYALWEFIVNGDVPAITSASAGTEGPILPKTAKQKLARKNELKAKSTLLLAIPDEHLLKFRNQECKDLMGRNQGQLLRSLPSAWNNIALIMRNKSDLDTLSMDDLYNNLKVYESEIKVQSSSSLNSQNVDFVSLKNISSTNEAVNTAHEVSTASSQGDGSQMASGYAYHEGEKILKEDMKEFKFQWQRNYGIGGYDWSLQAEEGITNFSLMAYTSQGYQMGLESLEARIVVHEKNEAVYEEDIAFLKYDVQVKDISIKDLKNQLEEALKEKDDLKLKLEKFEESSKNLTKLINSQISAKDKAGLGYDSQINENEVVHSVFNSRESDVDDSPVNDRFKTGEGFHVVPTPYTGNYMPSRPDLSFAGLDDYVYKTKVSNTETSISKTSKDIVEKPKTVRPSAPIIEDWDTNSDNDSVFRPKSDQTKPKFTKINFVKSDENVKSVNKENTHRQVEYPRKSQSPRDNRRNWNGMMT